MNVESESRYLIRSLEDGLGSLRWPDGFRTHARSRTNDVLPLRALLLRWELASITIFGISLGHGL